MRSQFRFPAWTIFLMLVSLVSVVFAIEQAQWFSQKYSGDPNIVPLWSMVPRVFLLLSLLTVIAGAAGYVILLMLRRSGAQRLSNVRTWPQQR
jgi:hypothetical protein